MTLLLTTVVPVGIAGLVAGGYGFTHSHRGATRLSAALGLATLVVAIGAHGWALARAFGAVAGAPPESKQRLLAESISAAMWTLPIGAGLALACVVLSTMAWLKLRRDETTAAGEASATA